MADNVLKAVAKRRDLVEGGEHALGLNATIRRYVGAQLYGNASLRVLERLRREIVRDMARKYFPVAQEIGRASAEPILRALGGQELVTKGGRSYGRVLQHARLLTRRNIAHFQLGLEQDIGQLKGDIRTAFSEALLKGRTGKGARQRLIEDLVGADRDELASIRQGRLKIRKAARVVRRAENRAARTHNYAPVEKAHEKLKKAKGLAKARKSFLARFETRCQGRARDAIRREASNAQQSAFTSAGYDYPRIWIAVNAGEACPSCQALHGTKIKSAADGPGNKDTYCGGACMCQAVPEEYRKGKSALDKPLRLDRGPSGGIGQ